MSYSLTDLKLYCAFEYDPLESIPIINPDPSWEYGYQWAVDPKPINTMDPKPASCMALCHEAMKQLDDDFSLDDVVQLLDGSGYDRKAISNSVSQLAFKLGMRRVDGVYSRISFASHSDQRRCLIK